MIYAPFCGTERKKRKQVSSYHRINVSYYYWRWCVQGDRRVLENEKIITDVAESIIMCELYPKSEITITIHVLETDG